MKGLKFRRSGNPVRERLHISLDGLGTNETISCFPSSLRGLLSAAVGRVLMRKSNGIYRPLAFFECSRTVWYNTVDSFTSKLSYHLSIIPSIAEDLFPGLYQGRVRNVLEKALIRWNQEGDLPQDAVITMFLKYEKDIRSLKKDRIPRAISPPTPKYRLRVGCKVKPREHIFYDAINKLMGYKCVAKGVTYDQMAQMRTDAWNSFSNPSSIDLDVVKLDASITQDMLIWVFGLILQCVPHCERHEVKRLLNGNLHSRVRARADDGKISYKVKGTLTSGQSYTSLAGVLVVVAILYPVLMTHRLKLINLGDDCQVIGDHKSLRRALVHIKSAFTGVGMFIDCGPICNRLEDSLFCQTYVIFTPIARTVRNPYRALSLDPVCLESLSPNMLAAWCRGVGLGGLSLHGGIPVMQNFYRAMVRAHDDHVQANNLSSRQRKRMELFQFRMLHNGIDRRKGSYIFDTPSVESRLGFYSITGVTPDEQLVLEKYYDEFSFDLSFTKDTHRRVGNILSVFFSP